MSRFGSAGSYRSRAIRPHAHPSLLNPKGWTTNMNLKREDDRLIIIIPYRDREQHLTMFIPYMETFLAPLSPHFIVVEQCDSKPFNKGKLLNIGFSLIQDLTSCVCFHDVDMLPLDKHHFYECVDRTTHIAGRVEQFGFELPYPEYLGGVFLTPVSEFRSVNGFPNEYWGYGHEDDEMYARYHMGSIAIDRKPGRYLSLPHERSQIAPANARRFWNTLSELAKLPHSAQHIQRIRQVQAIVHPTPISVDRLKSRDASDDGLTTLSYEKLSHIPLQKGLPFLSSASASHELVRAFL